VHYDPGLTRYIDGNHYGAGTGDTLSAAGQRTPIHYHVADPPGPRSVISNRRADGRDGVCRQRGTVHFYSYRIRAKVAADGYRIYNPPDLPTPTVGSPARIGLGGQDSVAPGDHRVRRSTTSAVVGAAIERLLPS